MIDYKQKIKQLISEKTGLELNEIEEEFYFEEDLNIDELELIEIITDLEEILAIEFEDEEKENLETVQDLLDLVAEKVE